MSLDDSNDLRRLEHEPMIVAAGETAVNPHLKNIIHQRETIKQIHADAFAPMRLLENRQKRIKTTIAIAST